MCYMTSLWHPIEKVKYSRLLLILKYSGVFKDTWLKIHLEYPICIGPVFFFRIRLDENFTCASLFTLEYSRCTSRIACALNAPGFYNVTIAYSRLENSRLFSLRRSISPFSASSYALIKTVSSHLLTDNRHFETFKGCLKSIPSCEKHFKAKNRCWMYILADFLCNY